MIFYFAGEPSGDVLGSELVDSNSVGVGGPLMQKAGLKPLFDFNAFQVMGFSTVLPALPRIFLLLHKISRWIVKNKPQAVVLIDYAEFNMLLAKKLRKAGYKGKIIHYVCPSVWAWRKKRIHTLEATLDRLLSILPFEKELFEKLPVSYVGHPLERKIAAHTYTQKYDGIALFPGSRTQEIKANLPLQLAATEGKTRFISLAREELRPLIEKIAPNETLVSPEYSYDLMKSAKGALATCGTVVLELALHQTPTVVTYPISPINYFIVRRLFKVRLPFYALPNLIANRELFPEFIHRYVRAEEVSSALTRVMNKPLQFHMSQEKTLNPKEEIVREVSLL
ncbi:MAG: lipid-A-disaccharide synthase [Chlamydiales bacterium]|nr:lipid-A-disaccharide synthase [Chlamydiales bacterium]